MDNQIIPQHKLDWSYRALLVSSYLKHLRETEFQEEMINLLEEFLKSGGEYVKEVIDTQFSSENLQKIHREWNKNKDIFEGEYNDDQIKFDRDTQIVYDDRSSTEVLENLYSQIEDIKPDLINELANRVVNYKALLSSKYTYYSIFEQLNDSGYYTIEDLKYGISLFAVLFEQEQQNMLICLYNNFEKEQANYKILIRYFVQMINRAMNNRDDFDIDGDIENFLDVIVYACDKLNNFNGNYDSNAYNALSSTSINSWKEKAGKMCSEELQKIFDKDSIEKVSEYENLADKILEFVPEDINALQIKNWCLEVQLDECSENETLNIPMRPICEIATDIKKDWGDNINISSEQYLDAMLQLVDINDDFYGNDSARDIVSHFLANSLTYVGRRARAYKRELRNLLNQE